jgi:hypothetical protein
MSKLYAKELARWNHALSHANHIGVVIFLLDDKSTTSEFVAGSGVINL